jgi:hypothetical protein
MWSSENQWRAQGLRVLSVEAPRVRTLNDPRNEASWLSQLSGPHLTNYAEATSPAAPRKKGVWYRAVALGGAGGNIPDPAFSGAWQD